MTHSIVVRPRARALTGRARALLLALLASCGAALAAPVLAAPLANDVPTLIDSHTLTYDDAKQTSVFQGNVVLTRGELTLRSARLELRQDDAGNQFAVATAGKDAPVFVRQAQPGTAETVEGTAQRAEYDSRQGHIDFIGNAVVSRMVCGELQDQVKGDRIRYDQQSDRYTATGSGASGADGRVRTVIQPRRNAPTTCPPASGARP